MTKPQDLGRNFEYRVRDWLQQRDWQASRVPVSGIAQNFKNDIHAHHKTLKTRLEVECKKTNKNTIRLFFDDIRKVEFTQDHLGNKLVLLVFATYRSSLYCIIPSYLADAIFTSYKCEDFSYSGKKSISLKKKTLKKLETLSEEVKYFLRLTDKKNQKTYLIGIFETVIEKLQ